jgi:outer membrane receptor protein involved in Fe transport
MQRRCSMWSRHGAGGTRTVPKTVLGTEVFRRRVHSRGASDAALLEVLAVRRVFLPTLMLIIVTAATAAAVATQSEGSGAIEGTVVERFTGAPLFAADVTVDGTRLGGVADRNGRFRIEGVPSGSYDVRASMMGYEVAVVAGVAVGDGSVSAIDFELGPEVLDIGLQMLVEAKYFQKDVEKPTSFKSLTTQELRYAPGAMEDVFRVVQSMPGVSPADMTNSNLIVRGGNPDENRTLLDNIEIPRALHFARPGGMIGGVSIISPSLIDRVDFLTGGFPAQYGDRVSSVFEMKLKDGNSTGLKTDLNLNLGGFSLVADGPVPGGGTAVFSVRRGVFDLVTAALDEPALPSYWDVVGKVTYSVGDRHKLSMVGFYFPDDLVIEADPLEEDRHGVWTGLDLKRRDHGNALGLNWRYMLGAGGYTLTTASYVSNSWTTSRGTDYDPDMIGDSIREDALRLKSELIYKLSERVNTRVGVFAEEIRSEHHAWSIADTFSSGYVAPAYRVTYDPPPTYKGGSFVQTTLRPFGRVSVTTGLRYDYYDFTGESVVSPRVGIAYPLTDTTTLNAAYGHYYQTPATWQVALHPLNIGLRSSRSVHYVAGLERLLSDDAQLTVEVYHKDLTDAFVYSEASRIATNEGSGYARGVEVCLQKKMSGNVVGSLAYTYSLSRRRDGEDLPEYYSDYDRPHNLTLVAGYKPSEKWRIGAKFLYATGAPYTPMLGSEEEGGEWYLTRGPKNSARYPAYHMLDIRVDRTFRFSGWTLMAYLDLWNVYGRRNVTYYDFDVDDGGTVSRTAVEEGTGMMPILGLEAKF